MSLLDANVPVALRVPEHEHHRLAVDWFAREAITEDGPHVRSPNWA